MDGRGRFRVLTRSPRRVVWICFAATKAGRWTASHCAFAKMRRRIVDLHAVASNIPYLDTLTVEREVRLVLGDLSRTGCGGGRPSIAYSQKMALEFANVAGPKFTLLSTITGQPDPCVRSFGRIGFIWRHFIEHCVQIFPQHTWNVEP